MSINMMIAKDYSEWPQQWDHADTMQTYTPAATEVEVVESYLLTASQSNVKAVISDHSTKTECRLHNLWLNASAWTNCQTGDSQVSDQHGLSLHNAKH